MSYPPEEHLLRDLMIRGRRTPGTATNRIEAQPGLLAHGEVRLGVMATLLDVTGAGIALTAVAPDWIATADLSVHVVAPAVAGPIEVECTPLRIGTRSAVVGATLRDGDGATCATGRMAFSRIPGRATTATIADTSASDAEFEIIGGKPLVEPVTDRCGMVAVGPGQLVFDKSDYVRNSFGTVNGGVLALAAEAAAVSATAHEGVATDLQIHYLEQVADGPVAVTAEVVRTDGNGALCLVRIEDRATRALVAICDVAITDGSDRGAD